MEVNVEVSTSVDVFQDSPEITARWCMSPRRRRVLIVLEKILAVDNSAEVSNGAENKTVATSTKMIRCR